MVNGRTANRPATTAAPAKAPPKLQIKKPGDVNRDSMCIYGYSNAGKTTLLGTMDGRGLIIEAVTIESGTKPLASQAKRLAVLEPETWDEVLVAIDQAIDEQDDYDWVAFDTISAYQSLAIDAIKGSVQLHARQKITVTNPVTNQFDMTQQDWGILGQMMGLVFAKTKAIRKPKIYLARASRREDHKGDLPTIEGPDLSPASLTTLLPSMALIGRIYEHPLGGGKWERRLQVRADQNHLAKFTVEAEKYKLVPSTIRQPHLGEIWAFINGDGDPPEGIDERAERRASGGMMVIND